MLLRLNSKAAFTPGPFVSFRSGMTLWNYSVREKVYLPARVVGSYKCGKRRCKTCFNVQEVDTFRSSVDGRQYRINYRLVTGTVQSWRSRLLGLRSLLPFL